MFANLKSLFKIPIFEGALTLLFWQALRTINKEKRKNAQYDLKHSEQEFKDLSSMAAKKQVNTSISRHFGGTGLGLPISQQLVNIMGGTLEVKSQEGIGSEFSFSLHLEQSPTSELLSQLGLAWVDTVLSKPVSASTLYNTPK